MWTCCNLVLCISEAGLDWGTYLTSAILSSPRRSGWWMGCNQQQTDLPQETSPHRVYGNQHFSRDPLIATEGGGGWEGKNNWILPHLLQRKSADRLLFTDQNMIYRPAAKRHLKQCSSTWLSRPRDNCQKLILGVGNLLMSHFFLCKIPAILDAVVDHNKRE